MKKKTPSIILAQFVSCTRKYQHQFFMLTLLLFILNPSLVFSQNLDDFRTAAAADGVNLIPFPSLRSEASTMAEDVQRKKDEVKSYDYDLFVSQKDNILKENKKKKEEIEGIKKDIEDLKKKYTEISVTSLEEDIKKRDGVVYENNKKLDELNGKLKNAAEAFGNLNTARAKLREQFDKVLRELPSAKSSPDKYLGSNPSEDDKKKFENYLSVIEDQIESQVEEHKKQEDGAKSTREKFEQLIRKTDL